MKVFLSHSSKQKPLVEKIANLMGQDNCVVDKYNFEPGQPTLDIIIKELDRSDLFVIFLSNDALDSAWVKREIQIINNLHNEDYRKQVLAFLIDYDVDYNDPRIPNWLRERFNLKHIVDASILYKKIDSVRRDILLDKFPHIKKREGIFVGRNDLMEEFETKYWNLQSTKPSTIIVSGFEEIGRRKFIKNALDKVDKLNKFHNPISIALDSRDSVEDFILRLEDSNLKKPEDIISIIKDESLDFKVEYGVNLLRTFKENNELLFIIDRGCIVQPNRQIAQWFERIIKHELFNNYTAVCVISNFKPIVSEIMRESKIITFHVSQLSPVDRRVLFMRYCNEVFDIHASDEGKIEKVLAFLNGMPAQVFHAAELISHSSFDKVISNSDEIKKYSDIKVYKLVELIKEKGSFFFNLLVFISKFEFISFDFIYKIFGRNHNTDEALELLFIYGIYEYLGSEREYLQIHSTISDYLTRGRFQLLPSIKNKLKLEVNKIIKDGSNYPDISQILVTVSTIVSGGGKIPDSLFIPSYALRTIVDHYYNGKYDQVIELANKIIENYLKYDQTIVREVRYWMCMALARKKDPRFNEHIGYFEKSDFYFLLGFSKRMQNKASEAEKYFNDALKFDPESQKCKRELVNVLLNQHRYPEALKLAKSNYEKKKLNAFHILAYFMCLIRRPGLTKDDKLIIDELMGNMKRSHDFKSEDVYETMKGEYKFYIEGNIEEAIGILNASIEHSEYKNYPRRALLEISKKRQLKAIEARITKQIQDAENEDFLLD